MSGLSSAVAEIVLLSARKQITHSVASASFLVYDLLTTLEDEVEYVWGSSNALPKYLYFVSRYLGLFGQLVMALALLPVFCKTQIMSTSFIMLALVLTVDVSLMLRIDALYGRDHRVRLIMAAAFSAEVVACVVVIFLSWPRVLGSIVEFPPSWPMAGCILQEDPLFKLSWVPILVFDSLLFALNSVKCISFTPLDHTPLIYRLFRDASLYYAVTFTSVLFCTIAQFTNRPDFAVATSVWLSAFFSYSGCHLLLGIRKAAARKQRFMTPTFLDGFDLPIPPTLSLPIATPPLPPSSFTLRSRSRSKDDDGADPHTSRSAAPASLAPPPPLPPLALERVLSSGSRAPRPFSVDLAVRRTPSARDGDDGCGSPVGAADGYGQGGPPRPPLPTRASSAPRTGETRAGLALPPPQARARTMGDWDFPEVVAWYTGEHGEESCGWERYRWR